MRRLRILACLLTAVLAADSAARGQFRTIDGTDNNVRNPAWGSVGVTLRRIAASDYGNDRDTPAGADRPGGRAISVAVATQTADTPNRAGASLFLMQWGQFLDHDIDLSPEASPAEHFDIPVPFGDPVFDPFNTGQRVIPLERSAWVMLRRREQLNTITAWMDASQVYGSDVVREAELRAPGGRLKTSAGDLLPFNTALLPNAPSSAPNFFLAGDVRANEQIGLTAMHTLFVREHNRLEQLLRPLIPHDPEARYQVARMIVGAEMQAITYREFLPLLLGQDAIPRYRGYDDRVDGSIANLFSTAAYRFGHSTLPTSLWRIGADLQPIAAGHIGLADAFFDPAETIAHGIEPTLRGLAKQAAQEVDSFLIDEIRNVLQGPPGTDTGFDLAALNIQRGRDHGLPSYNDARRALGLRPARSFSDVSSNPVVRQRLQGIYRSVEDIDVWVGGLAEDHVRGAMLGPLFHRIIRDQFVRLRDGDRFYYERTLPQFVIDYVHHMTLARIIRANTTIGSELQRDVFRVR